MPIGVPRIIYCWGEELPAQWTDIYNFIFRRRMVFLMQYLDDELCNQICGLLINIHMEDRSKELEKKEIERSGMFSKGTKSTSASQSRLQQGNDDNKGKGMGAAGASFYNKKSRSMEDLLNADEDLGISDINTLEQYTLQKITTEWLNWNAQFFDYSDEPYLFYLAELLSKDFNKSQNNYSTHSSSMSSEVSQLLNMLKISNSVTQTEQNRKSEKRPFKNQASMQMGEVYSPFRTNTKKFLKTGSSFSNLQRKGVEQVSAPQASSVDNAFENFLGTSNNCVKKKQKLLQMLQIGLKPATPSDSDSDFVKRARAPLGFASPPAPKGERGGKSNAYNGKEKTISNLLSNLAHKDFSSKLEEPGWLNSSFSSTKVTSSFGEHQRQKNLRSSFSLEKNFGVTRGNATALPYVENSAKAFNYLNTGLGSLLRGEKGVSQNEFRDYYRKQTERTLIDEESKKVFVIINSFGGSVGNGITVHDALQFIKAGSLTLGLGVAASAASLALAGGTIGERYVTEGCHVMIHQPECLTPDHNVLTDVGWIPITDVTLNNKVAVLDEKGVMTYEHPTKIHTYDYEGPMYEVKTTDVDLLVTPNHRMYVNTVNSSRNYELVEAQSIMGKKVRYKNNAIWDVPDYQFVLPEIEKRTRLLHENSENSENSFKPDMDAWLTFFGLWIAEDHTQTEPVKKNDLGSKSEKKANYAVTITPVTEDVREILKKTFTKLGYNWTIHSNNKQISVSNKQLWSYLNPLDKGALNKCLPDWVWELSFKQCNVLLNALVLGDGRAKLVNTNDNAETVYYFSGSHKLALDVCRLALHAGAAASIQQETAPSRESRTIRGSIASNASNARPIETNNPLLIWRVNILKSRVYSYANYLNQPVAVTAKGYATFGFKPFGTPSGPLPPPVGGGSPHSSPLEKGGRGGEAAPSGSPHSKGGRGKGEGEKCQSNSNIDTNDRFINYKGTVHCLTVPNSVFYVQRNGKAVWTGNSSLQGQASDIWIDSQEIMKIRLDVAEIYSLSTYRPRHKILRDLDRDFYLTATETIQYGLADEIATNEVMHVILEETNRAWDYHDSKQQRLLESRESASSGLDTQTQN